MFAVVTVLVEKIDCLIVALWCSDNLLPLFLRHLDSAPSYTQTIACSALLALAYNNHKVCPCQSPVRVTSYPPPDNSVGMVFSCIRDFVSVYLSMLYKKPSCHSGTARARCQLNLEKCCTNVRRIALEKACNRRMPFKVI